MGPLPLAPAMPSREDEGRKSLERRDVTRGGLGEKGGLGGLSWWAKASCWRAGGGRWWGLSASSSDGGGCEPDEYSVMVCAR